MRPRLPRRLRNPVLLVNIAAVLALIGLTFMVISLLIPKPVPVVLAMTVGQAIGTLSLVTFGLAVWVDLRRSRVLSRDVDPEAK